MKRVVIMILLGAVCCLYACKQDDDISDMRIEFTAPDESTLLASPLKLGDSINFQFRVKSSSEVLFVRCRLLRVGENGNPYLEYVSSVAYANFYDFAEPIFNVSWYMDEESSSTDFYYREYYERDPSTLREWVIIEIVTEDIQKKYAYEFTNMSW